MKILLRLFLFTFFLLFGVIILLIQFVDKSDIIETSINYFTDQSSFIIDVGQDSQLKFFPNPKIVFKDVKIYEKSEKRNILIKSEKLFLSTSWNDILKNKPKIKRVIFYKPTVLLSNVNAKLTLNKNPHHLVNFSHKNNLKTISAMHEIIINDGELIYQNKNDIITMREINLIFKNNEKKELIGDFFVENISSKLKVDIKTNNYLFFNIFIEQTLKSSNSVIIWKIILNQINSDFLISGSVNSKFFKIEDLFFKKKDLEIKPQKINFIDKTNKNIKINLDFIFDKISFKQSIFNDTKFDLISDGNFFEIKNFKSNLFDSEIDLAGIYKQKEKFLSGNLLVKNFKLKDWFKEKKFSLIDGDLDFKVIFTNKIFDFRDFKENLILSGSYEIKKPIIRGIDFDSSIEKLQNISSLNDVIKFLKLANEGGLTTFDKSVGKFSMKNQTFLINDFITKRENIFINSNGYFNIQNSKLDLKHEIKIQEQTLKNFPTFSILTSGPLNDLKIKYDLKNLREVFFENTLNKILKNEKKITINPQDVIDFLIPKEKQKN